VAVSLPRFEVSGEFAMKPTLSAMGMPLAFIPSKADLSGMDGNPYRLFIKEVVHKAFVKVDEFGTEAAAATAVVVNEESMPPQFRADRPFLFLIRDVRTGAVLFVGRVVDPTAKG
jgi:serpin B